MVVAAGNSLEYAYKVEGNKITIDGELKNEMQSTEDRLKQFESLIGDDGK